MHKYITNSSKIKLKYISDTNKYIDLHPTLNKIFSQMASAFKSDLHLEYRNDTDIKSIKKIFSEFISNILDAPGCKLENDIKQMGNHTSINLIVRSQKIKLNFIFDKNEMPKYINYISVIIHSLNTFCLIWDHNYEGLEINICLDQNMRNIPNHIKNESIKNKIIYLQKESIAFNVSGVTYPHHRLINLTKTEEIIKLLFHEMVHFIGLDNMLLGVNFKNNWDIGLNQKLNLSEAYTEFISVILYSMYESLHLSYLTHTNSLILFQEILSIEINYGVYLVRQILHFYEYTDITYMNFFIKNEKNNIQPILLWEYIFLRTILFLNLNLVLDIIPDNLKLEQNNLSELLKIFRDDSKLKNKLSFSVKNNLDNISVSYLAIDLDWRLI